MKARTARPVAALILDLVLIVGLGLLFLVCLSGCSVGKAPRSRIDRPGLYSLSQDGLAQTPAKASETTTAATVPPGSRVTASPDGSISWTAAESISVVTTRSEASGPAAFPPPAPPSPSDEADGKARLFAWLAVGIGAAAAAFGLLRAWPLVGMGGGCVAAAGAAILAAGAVPGWVKSLVAVGTGLSVAGIAVWHLFLKPKPEAATLAERRGEPWIPDPTPHT